MVEPGRPRTMPALDTCILCNGYGCRQDLG
jgi:hypothetical protein